MSRSDAHGSLVGVVLAAGGGTRLRPLTLARPKALCPVGGVALVDLAVQRAQTVTSAVAVNVHAEPHQMLAHLERAPEVHIAHEVDRPLGTAGALGALRSWIDGRAVLVQNADAWCHPDLRAFVEGWDGGTIRMLLAGGDGFHPRARVVATLMPWAEVRDLAAVPTGLYEVSWRGAHERGALDAVGYDGEFVDCATVTDYLRANLLAVERDGIDTARSVHSIVGPGAELATDRAGSAAIAAATPAATGSVVGAGAVVRGQITRSVVWDGTEVAASEHLVDAVRFDGGRTVLVRS